MLHAKHCFVRGLVAGGLLSNMAGDEAVFLAGAWSGQLVCGEVASNRQWTLTLSPSNKYPSAFGASLQSDDVTSLHGTWNSSTRQVQITEIATTPCEYTGTLTKRTTEEEHEIWMLSGVYKRGDEEGTFFLCKESDDAKTHVSGVWIGTAYPDAALADFFIPINPIRWCLTLLLDSNGKLNSVFGTGYFDDAADIPNKPVMFYTLQGSYNAKNNSFSLVKVYERSAQTSGYELEYNGTLESDENEEHGFWLKGDWKNAKGGSYGQFLCKKQPVTTNLTSHLCVCETCNRCIQPGESRWSCSECSLPWICCDSCHISKDITHQHDLSPEILTQSKTATGVTTASLVCDAFECFGARPFLYYHSPSSSDNVACLHYDDVKKYCALFMSGMNEISPLKKGERPLVAFCADMSPSYVMAMIACIVRGYVIVPVHASLDEESILQIFNRAQPNICFYDQTRRSLVSTLSDSSVSTWIELTEEIIPTEDLTVSGKAENENSLFLTDIFAVGKKNNPQGLINQEWVSESSQEDVVAVLFTSGSTGTPKGAMFTEELVFPTEGTTTVMPYIRMDFQLFDPSFILSIVSTMQCGGSRVLSNPNHLMDDFLSIRPTHIGATPVFWNSLFQEFLVTVNKQLQSNKHKEIEEIEINVAQEMRRKLGNRLFVATSGGAPISPQVLKLAKDHLKIDIVDLYGSRECGGITRDGIVYPGIDIHLLSLPELGYYNTSFPPQGEICVHSPRLIPGYWNDEELSAAMFVEVEGKKYYKTGDVGELITDEEQRRLKVIGRSSFVFKLAQGEWIAPDSIETQLEQCPWIEQAAVFGDSSHSFPVAVIVPSKLVIAEFGDLTNESPHVASLSIATQRVLDEIRFWCLHNHMRTIETPQSIALEFNTWTAENGVLTSTLKKKRRVLKQRYHETIEKLYERTPDDTVHEKNEKLSESFLEILKELFASGVPVSRSTMFSEIGDSLMAVKFVKLLKDRNVRLTNQSVFEYPFGHFSDLLDMDKHGSIVPIPQTGSIFWPNEWNLESYLTQDEISDLRPQVSNPSTGIMLTGCTGFLGPILRSEILIQYPKSKVYCLVRDSSRERVFSLMKKVQVWQPEWEHRIELVIGDISKPHLGVSVDQWKQLGESVAEIFHSGAWVNVGLPYSTIRSTNVLSTVEIIKLSLKHNIRMHFVSSISALGKSPEEDWAHLSTWDMNSKSGYAQSKVVSERLLHQAHNKFGLDVRVFRPGNISGDSRSGYSNIRDFTNLLIFSCLTLRCAVFGSSFVLSWIPADFVAAAMVKIAQCSDTNGRLFHLCGDSPSFEQVLQILVKRQHKLRHVSSVDWKSEVLALPDNHLAAPLRGTLQNLEWEASFCATPVSRTKCFLETQSSLAWPTVDTKLIEKYFDYFSSRSDDLASLGLIFE